MICIDAGITDAQACVLFIEERDEAAATEIEAQAAASAEEDAARSEAAVTALEEEAAEATRAEAEAEASARIAEDEAEARARAALAEKVEEEAADRAAAESALKEEEAAASQAEAEARAAVEADADAARAAEDEAEMAVIREQALADAQAAADALAEEETQATLAGSDTETEASAEVTSEVVTGETRRSSSEEFRDWSAEELARRAGGQTSASASTRDSGLSDLERGGLLALGAVVVGAILLNGQRVQAQTGDRVIVVDDAGTYTVLKDDDALLRVPGSEVRTERFADGSTRTVLIREDGTRIITVRDVNGRALRRVRIEPDGREYLLIDDTRSFAPVIVRDLPPPIRDTIDYQTATDRESLRLALLAADRRDLGRGFSLRQVREIVEVRELAPEINLGGITFETNSAAIQPAQAERLREMGLLMRELVRDNPTELFLVEGHTDAIGDAGYNLLLSDRRAESVALAFSEYFGVRAENMIVQGYGERFLKIPTQSAERRNRRVAVRRITTLVRAY